VLGFSGAFRKMKVLRRVFKAFQYRDFRLMWIGACTSSIGTWMQIVAEGWLVYRLSHSAFLLALDQFLMVRPVPGAAQYATPMAGLYLCGAGCHPGGGVMGTAGRNAARQILAQAA